MHPFFAFNLPHGAEWLIILVLALLFFGADKLPKLARGLGKSLGEFKKAKEDIEKEIQAGTAEAGAGKLDDKAASTASTNPPGPSGDGPTKKI